MSLAQVADRTQGNATALQRLSERDPEVPVEVGVDEWIQRAVEVPHPEYHRYHRVAALAAVAQRCDDVPVERERIQIDENKKATMIRWMDGKKCFSDKWNFYGMEKRNSLGVFLELYIREDQIWTNFILKLK